MLHSERFVDQAPATVYATLLDEERYLCSVSTMYRVLRADGEARERRRQAAHPAAVKPELVATRPNEVWSWDITRLLGPVTWTYYYLYVVIDLYSRYVPGWLLATRETAALAERLLAETIARHHVAADQLTVHADRGTSMASKPVALLLADLGVTKSHSRPHCSNDNPYSEAHFKTLKYRPEFPDRFGSIEDGRGRPRLLPALLSLVRPRAPPLRHWVPHARRRALRPRRAGPRAASGCARGRLLRPPRTVRAPRTRPATTPGAGVD